jgi:hypothetical protein
MKVSSETSTHKYFVNIRRVIEAIRNPITKEFMMSGIYPSTFYFIICKYFFCKYKMHFQKNMRMVARTN